jgi:hypothetical protein
MTEPNARAATRRQPYIDDVVCRADLETALQKLGISDAQITRTRHGSVLVSFRHPPKLPVVERAPLAPRLPAPLARQLEELDVKQDVSVAMRVKGTARANRLKKVFDRIATFPVSERGRLEALARHRIASADRLERAYDRSRAAA